MQIKTIIDNILDFTDSHFKNYPKKRYHQNGLYASPCNLADIAVEPFITLSIKASYQKIFVDLYSVTADILVSQRLITLSINDNICEDNIEILKKVIANWKQFS